MFKMVGMIIILESIPPLIEIAKEILKTLRGFYINPSCLFFIVTIHFYSLFMIWNLAVPQIVMFKTILI
jgi:hypothetical protein